ncbi:hypothetical protein D0859_08521 [Hortaea werneckii]|uniref:Rhodopsin domain-containing protein n=1 Tax=Hortaea werneckii TaxID=91943 RepID=A0A3M7IPH7_HORWE|nr:hypothetical protein D0859_08521 [Hortaea werneckii]
MSDELTPWERRFRIETWAEYAVGLSIIVLRILQVDDYIALQTIIWYTLLVVAINRIVFGGGSNFMTPEEEAALTPEIKAERVKGSKWVLVSEQAMIMSVWSCKAVMLILYRTLTNGLKQERWINAVAVYVACGWVATEITCFSACRPFSGYWSVPAVSTQCWSYWNFEYVEGVFNISADIFMLIIAIPVVSKVKLPWLQKAPLLGVFGLGIFVIAAAILTKLYCFVPALLSYEYLAWYMREVTVSIVGKSPISPCFRSAMADTFFTAVTMLPVVWSLLRDLFPVLRNWGYKTNTGSQNTNSHGYDTSALASSKLRSRVRTSLDDLRPSDSEEQLNLTTLEINKHVMVSVEEDFGRTNDSAMKGSQRTMVYSGPEGKRSSTRAVAVSERTVNS